MPGAFSSFGSTSIDARVDLHLPVHAVLHRVEYDRDAIEPLGKVGHLQQAGLAIDVEGGALGQQRAAPRCASSAKTSVFVELSRPAQRLRGPPSPPRSPVPVRSVAT